MGPNAHRYRPACPHAAPLGEAAPGHPTPVAGPAHSPRRAGTVALECAAWHASHTRRAPVRRTLPHVAGAQKRARAHGARAMGARARQASFRGSVCAERSHFSALWARARLAPPGPGRAGRCLLSREQLEVGATFDHRPQCPALCLAGHRLCRAEDEPVKNPLRRTPPQKCVRIIRDRGTRPQN